MGLLDKLGLPTRVAPGSKTATPKTPTPTPKAALPRATVILHNASETPLLLRGSKIGSSARFETPPPATVAPNASAKFRVVDKADIEATAGQVEYASEGGTDKAKVTFSWEGRAGEIRVEGQGRYATTSRYREDAQSGREYLLLFKETRKIRGPVLDALDEDLERVEAEVDRERTEKKATAGVAPAQGPSGDAEPPPAEGGSQAPAADDGEKAPATDDSPQAPATDDDAQAPEAEGGPQVPEAEDGPQAPAAEDGATAPATDPAQVPATDSSTAAPDSGGNAAVPDAPAGAATPEFAGLCKLTLVNNANVTLRFVSSHLDNDQAHFLVAPPEAVPAGRSTPFVATARDPAHPEIGGFANYEFRVEPAPEGNPGGEFELQIAWSGSRAGSHIAPPSKVFDVRTGGKPGAFVYTVSGPAIEFAPPPKQTSQPTMRRGDKSADGWVEYLQQLLNLQNNAGLEVDGDFGGLTHKAVVAYQRKLKKKDPEVLDDGVVGDQTWSYLREGAPAKPATDKRRPHTYVERGVEARWQTEKGALVYHHDRDIATLLALSVGDADQLTGRSARFRITSPSKVQKVVEALIGAGQKSSKSGQGNEHLVTVEAFSDLWGGSGSAEKGVYTVEAYFPGDLGGDTYTGSLTFEPQSG